MKHQQAVKLLSTPDLPHVTKAQWADLGCGTGTLTLALADLLAPQSQILAVDKERNSLKAIPDQFKEVTIQKREADFLQEPFPENTWDGILMANSLHYVNQKEPFLTRILTSLKPGGSLLIVEYDTTSSNPWIPYPVNFPHFMNICDRIGLSNTKKIAEKPSRFNRNSLYSAVTKKL